MWLVATILDSADIEIFCITKYSIGQHWPSSNYQFTGNTEDRGTCEIIPWGCTKQCSGYGKFLFFFSTMTKNNARKKTVQKEKKQSIKTDSEWAQMLDLADLKAIIVN